MNLMGMLCETMCLGIDLPEMMVLIENENPKVR
jgi:hypothetical protein